MTTFNLLKQNSNLTNYYYYGNEFTNEDIDKIIEVSKKYPIVDGNVSGQVDHSYRKSTIKWLPINDETKFIYDKIIYLLKDANSKMWNFNITNVVDSVQLSEYNAGSGEEDGGHYDWHMDFGGNVSSTRKISVSIQLTDENEYEGGDLEFMIHRSINKAPRKKGTAVFFPSYITHRVTKVTKGQRRSLVFWIHGPPFV
jgi:PKHD-type hydroxylase